MIIISHEIFDDRTDQSHGLSKFVDTISHVMFEFEDNLHQSHGLSKFVDTISHVMFGFEDNLHQLSYDII